MPMVGAAYMYTFTDDEEGDGADSVGDGGRCWRSVKMVLMVCCCWLHCGAVEAEHRKFVWGDGDGGFSVSEGLLKPQMAVSEGCNSVSDR